MNTCVWGPSTWSILHGLTAALPVADPHGVGVPDDLAEQAASLFDVLVEQLGAVLPCKYCRESYTGFLAAQQASQTAHDAAVSGAAIEWMYHLHNRVVHKLAVQTYEAAAVPASQYPVLLQRTFLKLEVLKTRLQLRQPYFDVQDLMLVLGVFALNASSDATPDKQVALAHFCVTLGQLLQVCGVYELAGQLLVKHARAALRAFQLHGTIDMLRHVAEVRHVLVQDDATGEWLLDLERVRASKCQHGVCA